MRRGVKVALWVLLLLLLVSGPLWADEQRWCPICGAPLKGFSDTLHRVTFEDGSKTTYCSLHCLVKAMLRFAQERKVVEKVEVMDYAKKKFVNTTDAFYLVGSKIPSHRSLISKVAFSTSEDAMDAYFKYGGYLVRYNDAFGLAVKHMADDDHKIEVLEGKCIEKGKALAENKGCLKCHGPGGKGPSWKSAEFAKRIKSKVQVDEAIYSGKGRMPAFKKKLTEEEIYSLTLYIWSLTKGKGEGK